MARSSPALFEKKKEFVNERDLKLQINSLHKIAK